MQIGISTLDRETVVIYVESGDTGPMVDLLEKHGHGYSIWGDAIEHPIAVIDRRLLNKPGYTEDHMLAIEAHELGHIHKKTDDEPTAELTGILLLEGLGQEGAARLLRKRGVI